MGRRKSPDNRRPLRSNVTGAVWGLGVILVSFVVLYPMRDIYYGLADEGVLPAGAYRIIQGEVIYGDFFEFQVPVPFYITASALHFFGPTMGSVRGVGLTIGVVLSFLSYIYGRSMGLSRGFSLFPPLFLLWAGFPFYVSHHWFALAFGLGGVLFFNRFVRSKAVLPDVFLCGVIVGLALLSVQTKGAALSMVFLGAILLLGRNKVGARIITGVLGTGLIPGLFFLYFLWKGSPDRFVYDTIIWPLKGYAQFNRYPTYFYLGEAQISEALRTHDFLTLVHLVLLGYIMPLALIASVAFLVLRIRRGKPLVGDFYVRTMGVLAGCAFFISILYRSDVTHLVQISPFMAIPMVLFFSGEIVPMKRWLAFSGRALLWVLLALSVYGNLQNLAAAKLTYINTVRFPKGTMRLKSGPQADNLRNIVSFVSSETKQREAIFVFHTSPLLYLLLDRPNATPFSVLIPGYNTPFQINDALECLKEKRPRVILQDGFADSFSGGGSLSYPFADRSLFVTDPIKAFVVREYDLVRKGRISIYMRHTAP